MSKSAKKKTAAKKAAATKTATVYCGSQHIYENGTRYAPGEKITGLTDKRIDALGDLVTKKKPE